MAPTADFKCNECDSVFSLAVLKGDGLACPNCDTGVLKRVWSVPAIKFIGKGFYVNDSKDYSKEYE